MPIKNPSEEMCRLNEEAEIPGDAAGKELNRPSSKPIPLRNPIEEAWLKKQAESAELYRASSNPIPFKDPFEAAMLEEQEQGEKAGDQRSTLLGYAYAPRQPNDAPPQIPPSHDVPPPPPVADDGVSDAEDEESDEVQSDHELPRKNDAAQLERRRRIQEIVSTFNEEQMARYEAFRRSGLRHSEMKKLLTRLVGDKNFSVETNIVVSALAKMFVGDLVERAREVMTERKESGPIRPVHIRESHRRLKLDGKTFKRTGSRLPLTLFPNMTKLGI